MAISHQSLPALTAPFNRAETFAPGLCNMRSISPAPEVKQ